MSSHELHHLIGSIFSDALVAPLLQSTELPHLDSFAGMEIREYRRNGLAVYADESGKVVTLFFYGLKADDHDVYGGALPNGLTFTDGKDAVIARLGEPTQSGKEKSSGAPWVRYDLATLSLHVRFSRDSTQIEQVALMSPAMSRGEV